ncbi:hypothetical protein Fmac_009192 [Flemingia macrophylla]|uniref:Uncharacterized protein n=1 Tax=Flemingia macrophylla TaxID=520843 RepID=A0ABD1N0E3_9FABA
MYCVIDVEVASSSGSMKAEEVVQKALDGTNCGSFIVSSILRGLHFPGNCCDQHLLNGADMANGVIPWQSGLSAWTRFFPKELKQSEFYALFRRVTCRYGDVAFFHSLESYALLHSVCSAVGMEVLRNITAKGRVMILMMIRSPPRAALPPHCRQALAPRLTFENHGAASLTPTPPSSATTTDTFYDKVQQLHESGELQRLEEKKIIFYFVVFGGK